MTYQRCQRTIYNLSTCRNWRPTNRHKPVYPPTHGVPSQCNSKNLLLKDWLCNNRWIMYSITFIFSIQYAWFNWPYSLLPISFYLVRCRTRIPLSFLSILYHPSTCFQSFYFFFLFHLFDLFTFFPSSIHFLLILSVFILLVFPYRFSCFLFIFLLLVIVLCFPSYS